MAIMLAKGISWLFCARDRRVWTQTSLSGLWFHLCLNNANVYDVANGEWKESLRKRVSGSCVPGRAVSYLDFTTF